MTSYTSPRSYRLNLSRFYENFSYNHREEYHLLDEKIKAFFSSIVEGFVHEPLHYWFFKTRNYPYTKKQKLPKILSKDDFRYRLIKISSKNYKIKESTFIYRRKKVSPVKFVRKHILRALYAPGLLKVNRLPLNLSSVKGLHSFYVTYKGRQYIARKQKVKTDGKKKRVRTNVPEYLRKKNRLFLTYRNNMRNSNPIIIGSCKVLKSTSIIFVQLCYYLDLDLHYTSEVSTILVYRLLASKKYLERVLNVKINFALINYFLFTWKYNLFNEERLQRRRTIVSLYTQNEKMEWSGVPILKKTLKARSGFFSMVRMDEVMRRKSLGVRFGLLKKLSRSEYKSIKNYQLWYNLLKNGEGDKIKKVGVEKKTNRLTYESLVKEKRMKMERMRATEEREFFIYMKEHIDKISTRLSRWQNNRFYKRTFNLIVPLFFYPFDSELLANLIAFELQNLRKGHGRYILFINTLLQLILGQKDIRNYRRSVSEKPLINAVLIKLKGRMIKSRRPSTRTQTISFKVTGPEERRRRKIGNVLESETEVNLTLNLEHYVEYYSKLLAIYIVELYASYRYYERYSNQLWLGKIWIKNKYLRDLLTIFSRNKWYWFAHILNEIPERRVRFELVLIHLFTRERNKNNNFHRPESLVLQLEQDFWYFFKCFLKKHKIPYCRIIEEKIGLLTLFGRGFAYYRQKNKVVNHVLYHEQMMVNKIENNNGVVKTLLKSSDLDEGSKIRALSRKKIQINNAKDRVDSYKTVSYNRFGIINIEIMVFYNH